jgi:5-methylcytosine-specific restriction endonuclease McrA
MSPTLAWIIFIPLFIMYVAWYSIKESDRKRERDEAYSERKGITLERLYQRRRNTADRRINNTTKDMVFRKYNYQCNYCGDKEDLHIDHIFPFSKYRDNSFKNLQILCRDCNLRKSDSEPRPEYHPELFGNNLKDSMLEEIETNHSKLKSKKLKKEIDRIIDTLKDV